MKGKVEGREMGCTALYIVMYVPLVFFELLM
jgi:hypothetical protein